MPLKIYRRKASLVWQYRGTLAGNRLRGSTGASDKATAQRIASSIEDKFWKRGLDGKEKGLTWPRAVTLYLSAGKSSRFLVPLSKYWGDAEVKSINAGSIRQSAVNLYPSAKNSTRNRQAIVPTLAIINHCAELNLCPPLRMKRFKVETKIKRPLAHGIPHRMERIASTGNTVIPQIPEIIGKAIMTASLVSSQDGK